MTTTLETYTEAQVTAAFTKGFTRQSDRDKQTKLGCYDSQYLTEYNFDRVVSNFLRQINVTDTCWLWTGTREKRNGYGLLTVRDAGSRKQAKVHRLAWELANGKRVPAGLTIDHTCEVTHCVRPTHLEPVTSQENLLRRWARFRRNRPSHCKHGHEYTHENSKVIKRGTLTCITCERAKDKRYRERRTACLTQ